ncbi:MAG: DUF86 domain-containing protein [Chloroflexi bacterium]|nr:DUF86 domain-containing protein [Chloroflexota bacterium]
MKKSPKNDPDQLGHILAAAQETQRFLYNHTRQEFDDDRILQLAVEKLAQNIGEAANQLTDQFKSEHEHIPWTKIIGIRHRLVHDFTAVDLDVVWDTVIVEIPDRIAKLQRIPEDN